MRRSSRNETAAVQRDRPAASSEKRVSPRAAREDNRYGRFEDVYSDVQPVTKDWDYLDHSKKGSGQNSESVLDLLHSGNPFVSRYGAILASLQRHGADSTSEKALSIYEAEGAATGPRTRERQRWFDRAHDRYLRTFDSSARSSSDPTWFTSKDKDEMLGCLRPLLIDSGYALVRNWKGRQFVEIDDLAVLGLLIRSSMQRVGYCNYGGLRRFFGLAGKSISNEKITRYIRVLVDIGKLNVISKPKMRTFNSGGVQLGESGRYEWITEPVLPVTVAAREDNRYGRFENGLSEPQDTGSIRRRVGVVTYCPLEFGDEAQPGSTVGPSSQRGDHGTVQHVARGHDGRRGDRDEAGELGAD